MRSTKGDDMTRYYSTLRPILLGGFPDKARVERIENFDTKTFCEEIGEEAWGFIEYSDPLTQEQADAYELIRAGMKNYWSVVSSVYDDGRVTAMITGCVKALKKPDGRCREMDQRDIYLDWFSSREDAEMFIEKVKNA